MSGFSTTLYNIFLKRSSTYVITIIGGTFIFERSFDLASNKLFESINKGKLWKDIKHKYEAN
ncbi:PREDICTED: cytochrome b-c1 complex subunit 9 [Polistes canadensis]|uniref:cytochrome b-c1 complex subunit 9 n=1 Tax=Polistes canadensis TaxID=91411 RepID=UPI000718B044|nr:PREDICTED: cytochrome b-c1 complex subunit 9 [Polistes canadensis]